MLRCDIELPYFTKFILLILIAHRKGKIGFSCLYNTRFKERNFKLACYFNAFKDYVMCGNVKIKRLE